MESERQAAYKNYLQTEHWKNKRLEVLKERGSICEKCKEWGNEIHHLTYENMWNEPLSDLQVLCRDCHEATHRALTCIKISDGVKNSKTKNLAKLKISRGALAHSISYKQLEFVCKKLNQWDGVGIFRNDTPETVLDIIRFSFDEENIEVISEAAKILGFKDYFPKKLKQKNPSKHNNHYNGSPTYKTAASL
jgi:hypothetical protein